MLILNLMAVTEPVTALAPEEHLAGAMTVFLTALGIGTVLVLLTGLVSLNGLNDRKQQIRVAWGAMDRELKARYGILSKLLSATSGLEPRPAAVEEIMAAKNQAAVAFDPKQLALAETSLTKSVRSLANTGDPRIDGVRKELTASEAVIAKAVVQYNDTVHGFNTMLESFPNSLIGKMLGFGPETEFHAGEV